MPSVSDDPGITLLVEGKRYQVFPTYFQGTVGPWGRLVEVIFDHQNLLEDIKRTSLAPLKDISLADYPEYVAVSVATYYDADYGSNIRNGETTIRFEALNKQDKPTWRQRIRKMWKALTYSPYMEILDMNDDWWSTGDLQEDIRNSR